MLLSVSDRQWGDVAWTLLSESFDRQVRWVRREDRRLSQAGLTSEFGGQISVFRPRKLMSSYFSIGMGCADTVREANTPL